MNAAILAESTPAIIRRHPKEKATFLRRVVRHASVEDFPALTRFGESQLAIR